jgi:hypothetical protein
MVSFDSQGVRAAVWRITNTRALDSPGLHEQLVLNQTRNVTLDNKYILHWYLWFTSNMREFVGVDPQISRLEHVNQAHPKKKLKQAAFRRLTRIGRSLIGNWIERIEYKLKSGELLRSGKAPRAIADLTTEGSLVGGYLMDNVKNVFSIPYTVQHGFTSQAHIQFIKVPNLDMLDEVFDNLVRGKDNYFYFFSDDSCIGVTCSDGRWFANVDISQCDGSNGRPVFSLLRSAMKVDPSVSTDVDETFDQLSMPCYVHSTMNRKKWVKLTPSEPVLYSGSVLTTCTNNMANTLIAIEFFAKWRGGTRKEAETLLQNSAREMGFIVTCEDCDSYHHLQFLKHSPVQGGGHKLQAILNLGVPLRKFGTSTKPIPGKATTTYKDRCDAHNSSVVVGYQHMGEHVVHDALKTKILVGSTRIQSNELDSWYIQNVSGSVRTRVDSTELGVRYGLRGEEVEALANGIRGTGYGQILRSHELDAIFLKDYGYKRE